MTDVLDPSPKRGPRLSRRVATGILLVLLLGVIAALVLHQRSGGASRAGRSADDVFNDIKTAGYPIREGKPASAAFIGLSEKKSCQSSKTFVRTNTADIGWATICVGPTQAYTDRISDVFAEPPKELAPVYVEDTSPKTEVFGFGWPSDASKKFAQAIGADGEYLTPHR